MLLAVWIIVSAIGISFSANNSTAAERPSSILERSTVEMSNLKVTSSVKFGASELARTVLVSKIDLPRRPHVSTSRLPLRMFELINGDRFYAELIEWSQDGVLVRLRTGTIGKLPPSTIRSLANPVGEVDVLYESTGSMESSKSQSVVRAEQRLRNSNKRSSTAQDSKSITKSFDPPLENARIEFWFRVDDEKQKSNFHEWQFERDESSGPIVVRSERDQISASVEKSQTPPSQLSNLSAGWHSFVAIFQEEQVRLLVDDNFLAAYAPSRKGLSRITFRPTNSQSVANLEWVDHLQVRRIVPDFYLNVAEFAGQDVIQLASGDRLFGMIEKIDASSVTMNALRNDHAVNWNRIAGMQWKQSTDGPVNSTVSDDGVVAVLELQSFVDRLDSPPERITVTVVKSTLQTLFVQHPWLGDLHLSWDQVRRLTPLFVGSTQVVEGRRFHLGNSIRSDFRRPMPDGTEATVEWTSVKLPHGKAYISLDAIDVEAAARDAPPGSPRLQQLRNGNLITTLYVNNQRVATLNEFVRFKPLLKNPLRIRIPVRNDLLRKGSNTIRFKQTPLNESEKEYDDCEISNIHLEDELP
jgi:hypothetical protein